ncbi:MAG: AMP-binding protein [Chitinophagaceae bacterium]|nr:AMP-binding protein [Oligoflexus sp.]
MSLFEMSWPDFWLKAGMFAESIKSLKTSKKKALWIPSLDPHHGLFLFAAALHLELDPIFDEKSALDPDESFLALHPDLWRRFTKAQNLPESGVQFTLTMKGGCLLDGLEAFAKRRIYFCTSGTTAKAKTLCKSALGLLLEARQLQSLYGLDKGSKIITLVRPFHIYGFLHSVLLSLVSGSTAVFWSTQLSLPTLDNGLPLDADLLITVPAHWSTITHLWSQIHTPTVVSSSAFFGEERTLALSEHRHAFDRYFELLGSTETGGIGYRRIDHEGCSFRLFEGVRIEGHENGSRIYSPFLVPDLYVHSPDQFEILENGCVLHRGRADRVFKFAGLRYTLGEIEDLMSRLCGGATVVCAFEENSKSAQGGRLRGWVETTTPSAQDLTSLRTAYQGLGNRPFPGVLHFVPVFPRDAQGKVSLLDLQRLTSQDCS